MKIMKTSSYNNAHISRGTIRKIERLIMKKQDEPSVTELTITQIKEISKRNKQQNKQTNERNTKNQN